jgi:hypothetical protein
MNLDCWQSFSYINKAYVHTLTCLTIMLLLKPEAVVAAVMAPVALARACGDWLGTSLFGKWLARRSCVQRIVTLFSTATKLEQRSTKVVILAAHRGSRQMSRLANRGSRVFSHRERGTPSAAVDIHIQMDRTDAAIVVQRLWQHRKPGVLAANRNIAVLRRNLLSFVSTAKDLVSGLHRCSQCGQCCRSIHCLTCSDLLSPLCAHPPG